LAIGLHGKIATLMIRMTLNGEPREFATDTTVAEMLVVLDYSGKRVAVERNGEIVPRSLYGTTPIAAGDRIEIVVAVGGG
jgi:sulfur carrier protein